MIVHSDNLFRFSLPVLGSRILHLGSKLMSFTINLQEMGNVHVNVQNNGLSLIHKTYTHMQKKVVKCNPECIFSFLGNVKLSSYFSPSTSAPSVPVPSPSVKISPPHLPTITPSPVPPAIVSSVKPSPTELATPPPQPGEADIL